MYIALLGRQSKLGLAELERVYGADATTPVGNSAALVDGTEFSIDRFGGILKAGLVSTTLPFHGWEHLNNKVIQHYEQMWKSYTGKLTLGISVYGAKVSPREVQKLGLILKARLKKSGCNIRLIPNLTSELSSATSHHNKLGQAPNKVEIVIVIDKHQAIIAESIGSQDITSYAQRDQMRPKRDAFVGMLPPKLAQIMINLAIGSTPIDKSRALLDPFCGTGVLLQEAALLGFSVYGTDLSEKMVSYTETNLEWLEQKIQAPISKRLHPGDAMTTSWEKPLDVVVCETYLGQPFSAPPSPAKLTEVIGNCEHIITSFLRNIHDQLPDETPLCLAVPAWRRADGTFSHLPLTENLGTLGYRPVELRHVSKRDLLYYREDQVVARELLILTKTAR